MCSRFGLASFFAAALHGATGGRSERRGRVNRRGITGFGSRQPVGDDAQPSLSPPQQRRLHASQIQHSPPGRAQSGGNTGIDLGIDLRGSTVGSTVLGLKNFERPAQPDLLACRPFQAFQITAEQGPLTDLQAALQFSQERAGSVCDGRAVPRWRFPGSQANVGGQLLGHRAQAHPIAEFQFQKSSFRFSLRAKNNFTLSGRAGVPGRLRAQKKGPRR